jgi:RNA recognition motif-containing protein
MSNTKVFVGNLSFKTKEEELKKEFEKAGKV